MKIYLAIVCIAVTLVSAQSVATASPRLIKSLDGQWEITDSKSPSDIPTEFKHTVIVPGLANLAKPAFPQVDGFISRENLVNRIRAKLSPADWQTKFWNGKVDQDRDYFWYRKTFETLSEFEVAMLKINKAQFGTAVWLNGEKVGEDPACFSANYFAIDKYIKWNKPNTLIVRIGAHPAVLPENFPVGTDFEKVKWTPGIYDSVSLIFCKNPVMESLQIAPRIASGEIVVQTKLQNRSSSPVTTPLGHKVKTWKKQEEIAVGPSESVTLQPGEEKTITQTIRIPDANLWSPENPFLYVLESTTSGDSLTTRFGMREFRFDATTKRAYLNGKVYYLRGSNITLHRFFEDPLCKNLPWNDAWVRQLLGPLRRKMHWNYFRFCIGPVPDRWLDICDEEGLLIQNEFPVWTGRPEWYPGYTRTFDSNEMIRQYKAWMRDNWNHPSVVVWDANNESVDESFGDTIIPALRPLDLSGRAWENSFNKPVAANDPVEYHPYLMMSGYFGKLTFNMTDLEKMDGTPRVEDEMPSLTNPPLINEYGWLWLNRDGSPTLLTESVYSQLMGPNVTPRQRLDMWAYLLAAETEFWRAHRHFAGILHFVYLTGSFPGVYTSDHFADVEKLKLDPAFESYVGESFKPLGVYLNFHQPTLKAGESHEFTVMMVNDGDKPANGDVTLTLETKGGKVLVSQRGPIKMDEVGKQSISLKLEIPEGVKKDCVLKATAKLQGQDDKEATISRRWVAIEK